MKNYAIILAGGLGSRMGHALPKQLLTLGNVPVIAHTVRAFAGHPRIHGLIVAMHPDFRGAFDQLRREYALEKIIAVTDGGDTRQQSSYNAVCGHPFAPDDVLLIHDAARPFVDAGLLDRCIDGAARSGAASVCVPSTDTIVIADTAGFIRDIPAREFLFNAQTPQSFRYALIRRAHEHALATGIRNASDDARLVLAMGEPVAVITGSYDNIKITNPADLAIAEAIAKERGLIPKIRDERECPRSG